MVLEKLKFPLLFVAINTRICRGDQVLDLLSKEDKLNQNAYDYECKIKFEMCNGSITI